MRRKLFRSTLISASLAMVAVCALSLAGYAQGKGRGKGGGHNKGGGQPQQVERQRGGDNQVSRGREMRGGDRGQRREVQRQQPQRQQQVQQRSGWQQDRGWRGKNNSQIVPQKRRDFESRRQAVTETMNARRQQQSNGWNARQGERSNDREIRRQSDRGQRGAIRRQNDDRGGSSRWRQGWEDRRGNNDRQRSERNPAEVYSRSRERGSTFPAWERRDRYGDRWNGQRRADRRDERDRNDRVYRGRSDRDYGKRADRGRDRWVRDRRDDRSHSVWSSWQGRGYYGYKNYGQYRSAQVHRRNADRKAARNWSYDREYYDPYYGRYYDDDDHYQYRYQVIRNIVYSRYGHDHRDRYTPYYGSYYYNTPYEYVYGSPYAVNYIYYGYSPQTYVYVPQYGQVAYDPYYANYGYYGYSNAGYGDRYDTGYYPAYYGDGYGSNNMVLDILGSLPVADLVTELTGNSFVGQLLTGFLTQGYDQGYLAGQYARENGYYDEDDYYDPYSYSGASYDAYSVNLAENRRIFSEGYEAGYRDAMLSRRDDYEPYYDSKPDLIGLLIGNTLSGI